jgi:hypothetical protein
MVAGGNGRRATEFTRREPGLTRSQCFSVGSHSAATTRVRDMERRRSTRTHTTTPSYVEPKSGDIYHPHSKRERWQSDWDSDDDDGVADDDADDVDEDVPITQTHQQADHARKKQRTEAVALATAAAAASTTPQSEEQCLDELKEFIATNRNANTHAAYASGWRKFVFWADTIANPTRTAEARVDIERSTERHVAAYARYLVETKRTTMSTVHTAIASIADHLRLDITPEYNPCHGPLLPHGHAGSAEEGSDVAAASKHR